MLPTKVLCVITLQCTPCSGEYFELQLSKGFRRAIEREKVQFESMTRRGVKINHNDY